MQRDVPPSTDRPAAARQSSPERVPLNYAPAKVEADGELPWWTFLLIGAVVWLIGSIILTPMAPLIGNAVGVACAIIAAIRFVRQLRRS